MTKEELIDNVYELPKVELLKKVNDAIKSDCFYLKNLLELDNEYHETSKHSTFQ